jgi:HK97 family phage portal protein
VDPEDRLKQFDLRQILMFSIFPEESHPSFDLDQFENALLTSIWLVTATYRVAWAIAGIDPVVRVRKTKEEAKGAKADRIRALLMDPTPEDDYVDYIEQNMVHLLLAGETYQEKARNGLGETAELWTWNPRRVTPIPDRTGQVRTLGYKFRSAGGTKEKVLDPEDVIAIRVYNPLNPHRGMSSVGAMWNDIKGDEAAAKHNRRLMNQGMRTGGVFEPTDGSLGAAEMRQFRESMAELYSGPENAGKPLLAPAGIKFTPDTASPKDMDFQANRRFAREVASGGIGAPPILVGNFDAASYANSQQQLRAFWDYIGKTWLKKLFGGFNKQLVRLEIDSNLEVVADAEAIEQLVDSQTSRVENQRALFQGGIVTLNEARKAIGQEPLPRGDSLLRPLASEAVPIEEETGTVGTDGTQDVQVAESAVLNGPQVSAAADIVMAVAKGEIPRDSGLGMLAILFNLKPAQAEAIMGSAGMGDKPTTPNPIEDAEPEPAPGGPPPPTPEEESEEQTAARIERTKVARDAARDAHERELRTAEARMAQVVTRYLREAKNRITERLKTQSDVVDVDCVLGSQDMELEEARTLLAPMFLQIVQDAGDLTLSRLGLGKATPGGRVYRRKAEAPDNLPELLELVEAFGVENPRVLAYLEKFFFSHLRDLTSRTLEQMKETLSRGITAGEGVPELVVRLSRHPAFNKARAEKIARTETIGALNLGSQEAFRVSGAPRKSWLDAADERTRESHRNLRIQTSRKPIPTPEKFLMAESGRKPPEAEVMYPGDPEAPAWCVVHCRCSLLPEEEELLLYWGAHCEKELGGLGHA